MELKPYILTVLWDIILTLMERKKQKVVSIIEQINYNATA